MLPEMETTPTGLRRQRLSSSMVAPALCWPVISSRSISLARSTGSANTALALVLSASNFGLGRSDHPAVIGIGADFGVRLTAFRRAENFGGQLGIGKRGRQQQIGQRRSRPAAAISDREIASARRPH